MDLVFDMRDIHLCIWTDCNSHGTRSIMWT